jgi:NAD(P)-dependent dehydrogenase (short-subunit alcohol dehydrogenase family)
MGVNLWGVIYGLKVFTPIMLAQDTEAHIVNVASISGLFSSYPIAPYHLTKQAVIGLTENLYSSLAQLKAKVKVSVVCPGWVKTDILKSERNRPAEMKTNMKASPPSLAARETYKRMQEAVEGGMSIQELASHVFRAIEDEQLYAITHPEYIPRIQQRFDNIVQGKNP